MYSKKYNPGRLVELFHSKQNLFDQQLLWQVFIFVFIMILMFGCYKTSVFAQEGQDSLYVPLIGISLVPEPLSLPNGAGYVTYHYAVKNFISEHPLTGVKVADDECASVNYIEGDDNDDSKLDSTETWRYTCTTKIFQTTQSIATAIGISNNLQAVHKAYATVVVGADTSAPLVNIINITKVAHPFNLPAEGGSITFIYRVNNPGKVPLNSVSVSDDKCSSMSSKLGDTNGNSLLDIDEVWVYTCKAFLKKTTTNTVSVIAYANGLKAVGYATLTVTVANSFPKLPDTGTSKDFKITVWLIMLGILAALVLLFVLTQKRRKGKKI